jgi:hypothetical protein
MTPFADLSPAGQPKQTSTTPSPCVGLGFLVRLRFALRSFAVWCVCAIAPSFVSGWRAFSSVYFCKYVYNTVRTPVSIASCACRLASIWWDTMQHLLPSYPVRLRLRLIRLPHGPAGRAGERPRPQVRLQDNRPPG